METIVYLLFFVISFSLGLSSPDKPQLAFHLIAAGCNDSLILINTVDENSTVYWLSTVKQEVGRCNIKDCGSFIRDDEHVKCGQNIILSQDPITFSMKLIDSPDVSRTEYQPKLFYNATYFLKMGADQPSIQVTQNCQTDFINRSDSSIILRSIFADILILVHRKLDGSSITFVCEKSSYFRFVLDQDETGLANNNEAITITSTNLTVPLDSTFTIVFAETSLTIFNLFGDHESSSGGYIVYDNAKISATLINKFAKNDVVHDVLFEKIYREFSGLPKPSESKHAQFLGTISYYKTSIEIVDTNNQPAGKLDISRCKLEDLQNDSTSGDMRQAIDEASVLFHPDSSVIVAFCYRSDLIAVVTRADDIKSSLLGFSIQGVPQTQREQEDPFEVLEKEQIYVTNGFPDHQALLFNHNGSVYNGGLQLKGDRKVVIKSGTRPNTILAKIENGTAHVRFFPWSFRKYQCGMYRKRGHTKTDQSMTSLFCGYFSDIQSITRVQCGTEHFYVNPNGTLFYARKNASSGIFHKKNGFIYNKLSRAPLIRIWNSIHASPSASFILKRAYAKPDWPADSTCFFQKIQCDMNPFPADFPENFKKTCLQAAPNLNGVKEARVSPNSKATLVALLFKNEDTRSEKTHASSARAEHSQNATEYPNTKESTALPTGPDSSNGDNLDTVRNDLASKPSENKTSDLTVQVERTPYSKPNSAGDSRFARFVQLSNILLVFLTSFMLM